MLNHSHRETKQWMPLLILAAGLLLLFALWRILLVFVFAAFFAFIINPVVTLFDRKLPRIFSIISVYLILTILIILIAGLFAPSISRQAQSLIDNAPDYLEQSRELIDTAYTQYLDLPMRWRTVIDTALDELQNVAVSGWTKVFPAAFTFFTGFIGILFIPLLALFMLLNPVGYKNMILAVTPRKHRSTMNDLMTCTGRVLWDYIKGRLLVMFFIGLFVGVSLHMVGMPYAAVFGILAGLLEAVPTFGPIITAVVISLIALAINPILALAVALITIVSQLLDNFFLSPYIMAKTVGLDPVTVLFALFLGGSVSGLLGALIAVPVAMMVKIVILYFYAEDGDLINNQAGRCRSKHK